MTDYIERLIICNTNIRWMISKEKDPRKKDLLENIFKANSYLIINL